jgi:predicted transposase/invertase (TIGR01784 family)
MGNQENKKEVTMRGKYLNPKADLTFKLVFGEHKDLTMSFLNALLPLAEDAPITSIEYETPEMVPEKDGGKNSVVDVRCTDARGRRFIVEMQMNWSEEFKKRIIMNTSKAIMKQVGTAEIFTKIQPVYSLNLLNDKRFQPDTDDFYHDYAILNVDHPERSLDYLRFVFVELPKFKPRNVLEKKMAVLWLRFLTEINEETDVVPPELLENEQIRKALSIVEKSAMTEGQYYAYERFWDQVNREHVLAEANFNDGLAQGIAQGVAQGIAQGVAEGEAKKNIEIARKMKSDHLPLDVIMKYTGLTPEEINSL